MKNDTINSIFIDDSVYPTLLRKIPNPPSKINYRGKWNPLLFENCLSVVGSRNITLYGITVLDHLFKNLDNIKLTIVSGFMRGVDIYAHENALKRGLATIAVLPCGIEYRFSKSLQDFCDGIVDAGGLIVSEFDGDFAPRDWTFVKRNRIVAGLSSSLLVIEAGKNSGSLITYEYAKRYNRKILTVPGDIFKESESGICHILKEGATPIFSSNDLMEALGIKIAGNLGSGLNLSLFDPLSQKILNNLQQHSCDLSQLCKLTSENFSDVCISVTNLQLRNVIKEIKGLFYVVQN